MQNFSENSIERIKQAEGFYLSAVYDFIFLKKYFHETEIYIISSTNVILIEEEGKELGRFVEKIPYLDLFHFIQTSFAFIEKGLKYLVFLNSNSLVISEMKDKFGHKLNELLEEFSKTYTVEYLALENLQILSTLKNLSEIDFINFRYISGMKPSQ